MSSTTPNGSGQPGKILVTVVPPAVTSDPALHTPPADGSRFRIIIEVTTDAPFLTADIQRLVSQEMMLKPDAHLTLHINRPANLFHMEPTR